MIAEAFLLCALAPVPVFVMHNQATVRPLQNVVSELRAALEKYPRHHQRLGIEASMFMFDNGLKGTVLFVGGDPIHVKTARAYGINAYGAYTEDYSGLTKWHAVTDPGMLSFREERFDAVFWHHIGSDPGMNMEWLVDVSMLVKPGGYFLFDEDKYSWWADYLHGQHWVKRMNHPMFQLSVWQRPYTKIARPEYGHFKGDRTLPLMKMPKWKMRWGVSHVLRLLGLEPPEIDRTRSNAIGRSA